MCDRVFRYGAHLSKEEVAKLVAPNRDTLQLVYSWLANHDIPLSSVSMTHGGCWLTLTDVPVSQVNELLDASYQLYQHVGMEDSAILRTVSYSLPAVLLAHVQAVAPTTFFSTPWQTQRKRSFGAREARGDVESREFVTMLSSRQPDFVVVPDNLRWLYKTFAYEPKATDRNTLGIVGYNNQFPSPKDLSVFLTHLRTDAKNAKFSVELVNDGKNKPGSPGNEANLNMQYAQAMAFPTPHIFYSVGGRMYWSRKTGEPIVGRDADSEWLEYLLLKDKIPQTISISYGFNESNVPEEYATALCSLYKQLGVRGVSILAASGDDGVGYGACLAKDGSGRVQFLPTFPASCMSGVLSVPPSFQMVQKCSHNLLTTTYLRFCRSLRH